MQLVISALMIVTYTIYFYTYTMTKKQNVSPASGKCISMSLGMVSSTMIGLILSLLLPGDLAYSTVLSIVVSCILAYFIGGLFGTSGIMEAMTASFMGAMMGAMLGDMILENRYTFIMISMDIIYLVTVSSLLFMINKETGKGNQMKGAIVAPLLLSIILFLSMISFVAILEGGTKDVNKQPSVEQHH